MGRGTPPEHEPYYRALEYGPLHPFKGGGVRSLPLVSLGVYTIWRGDEFVYVGHAGGKAEGATGLRRTGLADRLAHHSTGRRSGDQFCVYVADKIILGTLTTEDVARVAADDLLLDDLVYVYVQDRLAFRYTVTAGVADARLIEENVRLGVLKAGKPILNPLPARRRPPKHVRADEIRGRLLF